MANALLAGGLRRGDRVAMFCENSTEAILTKIGVAKAGGVVMPINTMMAADMVDYALGHVEPMTAIADAELWERCAPMFRAAGVEACALIRRPDAPAGGPPSWSEWVGAASADTPELRIHGDDIWEILMTSGTTAMPKAVMISHHTESAVCHRWWPMQQLDVHRATAPAINYVGQPGYETPKRVVALEELPVTVGGKVLKYKLRQSLA